MKKIWFLGAVLVALVGASGPLLSQATTTNSEITTREYDEDGNIVREETRTVQSSETTTSETETSSSTEIPIVPSTAELEEGQPYPVLTSDPVIVPGDNAEKIRTALLAGNYLSETELAAFTDVQLENGLTAFEKYNQDFYGMDLVAYVDLLNALFVDNTLTWTDLEANMSYNPNEAVQASDLFVNIDQLQAYLKAFYPPTSSFIPIKTMTNEELISYLIYLQSFENEATAEGANLPAGRIFYLNYIVEHGLATTTSSSSDTTNSSTSETSTPSSSSTSEAAAVTPTTNNNQKLPQTNETTSIGLIIAGVILLLVVIFIVVKKRKKE